MAEEPVDSLQIRIEKAKRELPLETVNAINAIDWRAAILGLRGKYGYTFEQLGDLELETELLLCGLVSSENYPRELERRMGVSRAAADELVNEMNNLVFKKIRGELIKNTERKKIFAKSIHLLLEKEGAGGGNSSITTSPKINSGTPPLEGGEEMRPPSTDTSILNKAGIEIVPELIAKPVEEVHPIVAQKLSASVQVPIVKTEHTLDNITKPVRSAGSTADALGTPVPQAVNSKPKIPNVDPYREIPE